MSDQFQKIKSDDLLRVVGCRGGTMHEAGCALLQLSVATTEIELTKPNQITLLLAPEEVEKVISSLQQSLSVLRHAN